MYSIVFILLTLFFAIYCEVLVGSIGIIIPLTALSVFYFSVSFGWKSGIFIGIIAGTILDMLYGRTFPLSAYTMLAVAIFSLIWLHQGEPESVLLHFLPGTVSSFINVFPFLLLNTIHYGGIANNFFILLFSMVAGALMLPVLILVYDFLAKKLGLWQYRGAKNRELERITQY